MISHSYNRKSLWILIPALLAGCISPELRTARIAINEHDWNRAMAAVDAELARMGPMAEPYYLKGMIYEQLGDWKKMTGYYDSSLSVSDQFKPRIDESRKRIVARYLKNSMLAADSSNWANALALVDTAIIVQPKEIRLYQHAAITAYNGELYDLAIGYSLRAIELEKPGEADLTVREILVVSHSLKKDNEETRKWAADLIGRVDPKADSATWLRAHDALLGALEATGDFAGAIEAVKAAEQHFPDRADIKMNLALIYIRMKEYDSAADIYRKVLVLDPDNFDANLNLGTILVNKDDWTGAIPLLKKAHELDPTNLTAVRNLMAAYYNTGQEKLGAAMKDKLKVLEGGN